MDEFEGVNLGADIDMEQTVIDQLETGRHRNLRDSSPGDWLVRASDALSPSARRRMSDALHKALSHPSADVRSEALRALSARPNMAQADLLLRLAQEHMDLFRGLRRRVDPPGTDRGQDFVQLVASAAKGPQGDVFRRSLVLDRTYGESVLASLIKQDPDWIVDRAAQLANPDIDPEGTRLDIMVFRLRKDAVRLRKLVASLSRMQPKLSARLKQTLAQHIRDEQLLAELSVTL